MDAKKTNHGCNLQNTIKEEQNALKKIGCDPAWPIFEQTYNWFQIRKTMSSTDQDKFQEVWLQLYNSKKKGAPRRTCR